MNWLYSKNTISVILLFALLSYFPLSNLKFEFNIEKFFPSGDPDLEFFQTFKNQFHSEIDDEYIFIGLKNNEGIFQKEFLEKADSLSRYMASFDSILNVYSLTNTLYIYVKEKKINEAPLVHISQPELYKEDSLKLYQSKEYNNLFISKDGKSIAISAFNTPNLDDEAKDSLLGSIQNLIDQLGFDESHLTAKIRIERTYVSEIEKNLKSYLIISFLLIALVLLFLFRSVRGIILPIITIIIAICWTLALISLLDYPVDIISSLLPPVLAVICMSDVVHISSKYIEELRSGKPKIEALRTTLKEIGLATFFTSITTAIGFFSLCISNIIPIRLFGLFAGVGVLLSFVIAIGFMFSVYMNSPIPKIVGLAHLNRRWIAILSFSLKTLIRNKYLVLGTITLLTVASVYYANKIQINSSLLHEVPRDNPILDDYKFIESQFAGTRSFEMSLMVNDTNESFFIIERLQEMEEIEAFLKDSCGVGFLISPLSFIKSANRAFNGGGSAAYSIPKSPRHVAKYCGDMSLTNWGSQLERYLSRDNRQARISGKLPDLTIKEFEALDDKFAGFFNERIEPFSISYKMTGSALLIDKIAYSLTENLLLGLLIAFCAISLIVAFLFRSFRMVLIVLIPNIIPLIFMAALMGMMGIYLKADTSVIFVVAFGIAVDDSIHFISRFRIELSRGLSVAYAVKRAYLSTGKALVITTLILLAGFVTLIFSSFSGTFYIGLLISFCLVVALVVDLTVLPLLILLFYRKRRKREIL